MKINAAIKSIYDGKNSEIELQNLTSFLWINQTTVLFKTIITAIILSLFFIFSLMPWCHTASITMSRIRQRRATQKYTSSRYIFISPGQLIVCENYQRAYINPQFRHHASRVYPIYWNNSHMSWGEIIRLWPTYWSRKTLLPVFMYLWCAQTLMFIFLVGSFHSVFDVSNA